MTNEKGPIERDLEAFKEAAREFGESFLDEFEKQTGALTAAAEALTRVAVAVEDLLDRVETRSDDLPPEPIPEASSTLAYIVAPILSAYGDEFGNSWIVDNEDPPGFSVSRPLWGTLEPKDPQRLRDLYQTFLDNHYARPGFRAVVEPEAELINYRALEHAAR